MRGPIPNMAPFGRALGFVAVAAIIAVVAVHLRRGDDSERAPSLAPSVSSDPIARELARCQGIGMAADDDAGCKAAWAENRRRFFAAPPADASPVSPASDQKAPLRAWDR
jgi:conjugative transfer region protein TrbK